MTDKELLELAAKAAGIEHFWTKNGNLVLTAPDGKQWNPLSDDGDALRLAVAIGIEYRRITLPHAVGVQAYDGTIQAVYERYNNDPYAATRRAIVRAAAEIGKMVK